MKKGVIIILLVAAIFLVAIVENLFKPALEDIKKIQVENFADRIKGANTQMPDNVINLREKR